MSERLAPLREERSGLFLVTLLVIGVLGVSVWLFFGMRPRECHDEVIQSGTCWHDQELDVSRGVALCRCKR